MPNEVLGRARASLEALGAARGAAAVGGGALQGCAATSAEAAAAAHCGLLVVARLAHINLGDLAHNPAKSYGLEVPGRGNPIAVDRRRFLTTRWPFWDKSSSIYGAAAASSDVEFKSCFGKILGLVVKFNMIWAT